MGVSVSSIHLSCPRAVCRLTHAAFPETCKFQYGDLHEEEFADLEVYVDLMKVHHHPNYTTTLGHCMYELVSVDRESPTRHTELV